MLFQGQKVVCVTAGWNIFGHDGLHDLVGGPEVGKIYTVDKFHVKNGQEFMYLVEFPFLSYKTTTGLVTTQTEPLAWLASHFRPANTKSTETGMAILRQIALTGKLPAKHKEKEAA